MFGMQGGKGIELGQERAGSKESTNPRFKKNTRIWWIAPKQAAPPRTEKPADELKQNWLTYIKQTESIIPKPTRIVTRPTRIWWISIKPADRINTSTMKPVTSETIRLNSTNSTLTEMVSELPTEPHSTSNDDPTTQILEPSVGAMNPEPTEVTLITTSNPADVKLMTELENVTESSATEATGLALNPADMDNTENSNLEAESISPTEDQVTQSVEIGDREMTKFGESPIIDPAELSGLDDEGSANDEMDEHSGPTETSELISSTQIISDEPDRTTNSFESGAESSSTQPDDSDFVNVEAPPVTESPSDSSETANVEQTTDRVVDEITERATSPESGPTSVLPLSASQANESEEELCDALDFTGSQSETSDPPSTETTVASDEPQSSGVELTNGSSESIDSDLIVFSYTGTSQSEPVGATESTEFTTFPDVDESTEPQTASVETDSTTEPSSTDSTLDETISFLQVTTDEPEPFTSENFSENLEDLPVNFLIKCCYSRRSFEDISNRFVSRAALRFYTLFAPPFKRITATSVSVWEMFQLR